MHFVCSNLNIIFFQENCDSFDTKSRLQHQVSSLEAEVDRLKQLDGEKIVQVEVQQQEAAMGGDFDQLQVGGEVKYWSVSTGSVCFR